MPGFTVRLQLQFTSLVRLSADAALSHSPLRTLCPMDGMDDDDGDPLCQHCDILLSFAKYLVLFVLLKDWN